MRGLTPPTPLRLGAISAALAASAAAQDVDFGRDVRPLLADRCFACHGPDEATREADLRLDRRDSAVEDRGGYAAIAPDDPAASELLLRITDEVDPMPPPEEGPPLSPGEVEVIRRWIDAGAQYDVHWAYAPPRRPAIPDPDPGQAAWPRSDVDAFVLARLEAAGLTPAPAAAPRALVRRLSFDLLGLPPTANQVEAFAADPSDAARDALIEELLASPHHAERMTTFWFDLVRFADTTGIHADNRWNIYPYRDWVIEAFRSNMPFDRFTREQLAGDLMPDVGLSQQVAAAYNRLNLVTREGGSQAREFLARYTADRVRNAAEVWLATTLGCAECHDHKFDPVTTREFYEFGAFFADIDQVGVYSEAEENNFSPELRVPADGHTEELARLATELAEVDLRLAAETPALAQDRAAWEAELLGEAWAVPDDLEARADSDTQLALLPDGVFLATGGAAEADTYRVSFALPGEPLRALRLELLGDASLPRAGPGRASNGNLVLSELEVSLDGEPLAIAASSATYEQSGYPVAAAHDRARGAAGWAVMRGSEGTPAEAVFVLAEPLPAAPSQPSRRVELAIHQDYGSFHTLGRWRITWTTAEGLRPVEPDVRALLDLEPGERSAADEARLEALHRERTPLLAADRARRAELASARDATRAAIPLVLQTRAVTPMTTRVLPRGNWMDETGEVTEPGVPAALGALPPLDRRATRLDLADWLVDGENPLVARVLVNRLWRMLLGRGLVTTLDDFGIQGAQPSHPDLLDHLACELVDSGWDIRHVLRLILRSSTYAQASGEQPDASWFEHQARFRLDAEFVRDNALAVSGLLVRDMGGPSVLPYQPAGYWAHLNFPKRTYAHSTGADLYRRALYGHWQRQYLHPSLLALDAPSRERCTAERARSNTPLAALALLNDPIFVEASRALAREVLHAAGSSDEERAIQLWRRALQRAPRASERLLVVELVAAQRAHYQAQPEEALRLLSIGASSPDQALPPADLAAWTSAARVVLNLHETIVRS